MNIYLAGGMRPRPLRHWIDRLKGTPVEFGHSELAWTAIVRLWLPAGHTVFDPRVSDTKVFEDYSFIDLMKLRQCDLVIAYLEAENPSGMGLAAEVAYAKGLGKTVLLINEKHDDRYTRFIENFADRVFTTFGESFDLIRRLA